MAQKDKKQWLRLFYSRWGFMPENTLRKQKNYAGHLDLSTALHIAVDNAYHTLIRLVFPFEKRFPKSKDSGDAVVLFPQVVVGEEGLFQVKEPILYGSSFYSLKAFVSNCPPICLSNAEDTFGTYTFSLEFFMLQTDELNAFRSLYLTSIKKCIIDTGIWDQETGKGNKRTPEEQELNKFVIKEFKTFKKRKPYPIEQIQDRWLKHLIEKYPNDANKVNAKIPSDMTIRRAIDSYRKK